MHASLPGKRERNGEMDRGYGPSLTHELNERQHSKQANHTTHKPFTHDDA